MGTLTEREREFYDKFYAKMGLPDIGPPLTIPGAPALEGMRLLVCGCGTGAEPIMAARAGANVFTFDISPVSVENTKTLARMHGFDITADVMDFHRLGYPDNFFDIVYGTAILHHVDCAIVGRELSRVLRPGGVGYFWENSDRNPVLRWFRRIVLGAPGDRQRWRFLFIHRVGTEDEYPLMDEEIDAFRHGFDGTVTAYRDDFVFFRVLAEHGWNHRTFFATMKLLDNIAVKICPRLMEYSFHQTILLKKSS